MATSSTSFRLSDEAKQRLTERAQEEGVSATSLLERLILEGIDTLEHPGIVFRSSASGRRAALSAGPDVWEVVARLRELDGDDEQRIETLVDETALHARQIRVALDYAAANPEQITEQIEHNNRVAEESRQRARQRRALLG
jgi:sarcosine oxidase gamma subunit